MEGPKVPTDLPSESVNHGIHKKSFIIQGISDQVIVVPVLMKVSG